MGRVARFLAVPVGDKARLLTAATLLLVVRVGIFVVSLSRCRRLLLTVAAIASRIVPGSPTPPRVARAVDVADTYLPGQRTCLMRSLTSETLHRLYGHEIDHRIGVDKTDDGTFEAHSWIEYDGEILIGDLEDLSRFEPLPSLNEADWL
ncbi:lasso peptide biosynthesis B2 protein [Halobacteria archaeon AArc-m2/3/4]|uniref:Lasso peptide biosynthesis B2 protein n=1 Tax=Natronoglomus mannanivorans TaxID=2979990 RepID=A0AAP2Z2A8_9EURY|nr:lasso peptide biosynthesis B2 protein [Halobacteria archaeon AArc-xg1-1]MCU4974873.1 lasso peptide biosynthesis B2 protein [Halobacteria archaeon AArc-m2/3/4]